MQRWFQCCLCILTLQLMYWTWFLSVNSRKISTYKMETEYKLGNGEKCWMSMLLKRWMDSPFHTLKCLFIPTLKSRQDVSVWQNLIPERILRLSGLSRHVINMLCAVTHGPAFHLCRNPADSMPSISTLALSVHPPEQGVYATQWTHSTLRQLGVKSFSLKKLIKMFTEGDGDVIFTFSKFSTKFPK